MTVEIIVRYFHFISIFMLVSSVVVELVLVKKEMTRKEITLLSKVDGVYGISAVLVIAAGLLLWLAVGKPAHFYSENWIFITKFSLVGLLGILSIYPTVFFYKNRAKKENSPDEMLQVPGLVKNIIVVEVILLLIIPVCATLMAKGIGL